MNDKGDQRGRRDGARRGAGGGAGPGGGPRAAAVDLLGGVLEARKPLSDLLVASEGPLERLDPPARARAQRLATGTLRHLARADALLDPHLRKPPPARIRAILRLAVVEHYVEGAPAHAVVKEAVDLARLAPRGSALAGMVNAVLRRALSTPQAEWDALPPPRLPGWLRKPLRSAWGKRAVAAMEAAHLGPVPLDLTPRDAAQAEALAEQLGGEVLPTGSIRIARPSGAISALPEYDAGQWWVQDAAAALPARLALTRMSAGARVLDLCAAPGGKALQLAAAGCAVTALDISGPRMERLRANLARTGLSADCVVADALHWQPDAPFDVIVLDAPCSATGTIRRHPDLPHIRDASVLETLLPLQAALLDRALGWLAPGGVLVYCVCSLLPAEGEEQARAALARHTGMEARPPAPTEQAAGFDPGWITPEGGLRLRPDYWPERGGMDGFYMIRLRWAAA